MSIVDYTGKLNNHEDYINILKKIKRECKYIEIVIINARKTNKLVDKFSNEILFKEKVSKWWGTETKRSNNLYRINYSEELFQYLEEFETFCKYYEYGSNNESLKRGDYSEFTDFGFDDIAFYDENDNCILCTTTHEGYIAIDERIIKNI